MADVGRRIAVTGASGYLGHRIVNRLAKDDGVELVLATDAVTPSESYGSKVVFRRYDVTEPTGTLLADFEIDSLVHLAFILEPRRNRAEVRRVNVDGAANVLERCGRAPVSHLLYLSSTSVYGAHRDNPDELTEDSPARPVRGFQYSEDKLEAEKLFSGYGRDHPDCGVAILRACPVLGPKADNYIARSFLTPVLVGFMGEDPPMQFIHEDDLVEIMARCVLERVSGLYNAAGRGTVRWSRMARMLGRLRLSLPAPLLTGLTWASWTLGLQSASPVPGLSYARYGWAASTERLRRHLGYKMKWSSEETWAEFARAQGAARHPQEESITSRDSFGKLRTGSGQAPKTGCHKEGSPSRLP